MKRLYVLLAVSIAWLVAVSPVAAATSYSGYLSHRQVHLEAVTDHMDDLLVSLDAEDYAGIAYDSKQLAAHYTSELKWHDGHKPLSCYKVLWTASRKEAQYGKAAYAAVARWWAAWPNSSESDWATWEKYSGLFTAQQKRVLAAYDRVTCR